MTEMPFGLPIHLTPEALEEMRREQEKGEMTREARRLALYNWVSDASAEELRLMHYVLHLDKKSRQFVDGILAWQLHVTFSEDLHGGGPLG